MNNFAQTINYMASAINMITRNTPGGTRQIFDFHQGNNFNNYRGNGQQGRAGRGRGRNQNGRNTNRGGRGRGRQGRGRGRDSNNQSSWGNHSGQNRSQTRSYTQEEWQNMSYQERNRVMRERERVQTARVVASMLHGNYDKDHVDDISTITTPTTNAGQSQAQGSTGNSGNSPSRAMRSIGQVSLDEVGQAFNRRRINAITTLRKSTPRYVASVKAAPNDNDMSCRAELDSHADTCGVNSVSRVLECSGQVAEVSGFANSVDSIRDVPIVKAAIAYDVPGSGETINLIINQALYFGDQLTHILLNPNQMRSNDIQKNKTNEYL